MTQIIPFDAVVAKKILESIRQVDLAKWLGKSPAWVNSHIKKNKSTGKWLNCMEDITQTELSIIDTMIRSEEITYIDEENQIAIAIRHNWGENYFVFIRDRYVVKCVLEISEKLKVAFDGYFGKYLDIDMEIKKILEPHIILGKKLARPKDEKAMKKFRSVTSRMHQYDWPMSYNEYCQFLGFDGYLPNDVLFTYNRFKEEIKQYVREDNKVSISSNDPLYKSMYQFSHHRGVSFNFFLNELGYERIYDNEHVSKQDCFSKQDEPYNKDILLKKLKNIQGTLNTSKIESVKKQRRRDLVEYMKQLYSYRCQICNDENTVPLIEKSDGTYYVEVHHLTPISFTDSIDNEYEFIDTYKNTIVVCAHHHKYLHYHQDGGFTTIEKDETGVYLISANGVRIQLSKNYHL